MLRTITAAAAVAVSSSPLAMAMVRRRAATTNANPSTVSPLAAAVAAVRCMALSPSGPSATLFEKLSTNGSGGQQGLVLRTGFATTATATTTGKTTSVLSSSSSSPSPSFAVLSTAEFESILHDALATVPAGTTTATTTDATLVNHNHLTRELQRLVRETDAELAPLLAKKAAIDAYAHRRYYPLLKYACLALLAAQFGVYFNWIFFVFDWNLIEPTTYFIGYTGVFCSLVYHYVRCDATTDEEFTWRSAFVYAANKKARELCEREGVDLERVAELEHTRRVAVEALTLHAE